MDYFKKKYKNLKSLLQYKHFSVDKATLLAVLLVLIRIMRRIQNFNEHFYLEWAID